MARSRRSRMPTSVRASTSRASTSSFGTAKFSRPKRISSSTLPVTIWLSMSWQTLPTRAEMSVRLTSQVSSPSTSTLP